jgi:hypothetical protein
MALQAGWPTYRCRQVKEGLYHAPVSSAPMLATSMPTGGGPPHRMCRRGGAVRSGVGDLPLWIAAPQQMEVQTHLRYQIRCIKFGNHKWFPSSRGARCLKEKEYLKVQKIRNKIQDVDNFGIYNPTKF